MNGQKLMQSMAILYSVAKSYGMTAGDLLGRNKRAEVVLARHSAMSIMRDQCKLTHQAVGDIFGRDHGTSLHACKNVRNWMQTDAKFRSKFVEVMAAAIAARHTAEIEKAPTT